MPGECTVAIAPRYLLEMGGVTQGASHSDNRYKPKQSPLEGIKGESGGLHL